MEGSRPSFVAREGIPFLAILALVGLIFVVADRYGAALIAFCFLVLAFLLFRDPVREIPAEPLGVVSPVDGTVVAVLPTSRGVVAAQEQKVVVRVNHLGSYTLRSPTEGKILDLNDAEKGAQAADRKRGLWLQTDEGKDVVLLFPRSWFWLAPTSPAQIGERLGQGQPSGYLRLAREAELRLPIDSRILVEPGQKVVAGVDLIGELSA
jgi:phosphatidylserine decarboxylase